MDTYSAINRLNWRFNNCKIIFVNDEDILAFQTLISSIQAYNQDHQKNNIPLYNLYTYTFNQLVRRYKTDITNPIPHRELHRIIDRPFNNTIADLLDTLNNHEQEKILAYCGMKTIEHPSAISILKKKEALELFKVLFKIDTNRKKILGQTWTLSEVKQNIVRQIKKHLNE